MSILEEFCGILEANLKQIKTGVNIAVIVYGGVFKCYFFIWHLLRMMGHPLASLINLNICNSLQKKDFSGFFYLPANFKFLLTGELS